LSSRCYCLGSVVVCLLTDQTVLTLMVDRLVCSTLSYHLLGTDCEVLGQSRHAESANNLAVHLARLNGMSVAAVVRCLCLVSVVAATATALGLVQVLASAPERDHPLAPPDPLTCLSPSSACWTGKS
jgi:hypothetical protein